MIKTAQDTKYSRKKKVGRKGVNLNFDVPMLLVIFTLIIFGLVMMYSASWDFSITKLGEEPTYMFNRQLLFLAIGLLAATVTSFLDYHHYRRLAVPGLLIVLGSLFLVFISGEILHGAARTILDGSFMPAEAAKIAIIIYLSVWLYAKRNVLSDVKLGLIPLGATLGVTAGLILVQPDLSAAATIIFLGGLLFFLAAGELKQIAFLLVLMVMIGWVVVQVHPTGSERVGSYLQGFNNPLEASYHVQRSVEAFVQGGIFGAGIGNSITKLTGLPLPATDSIFSVIGEETGMLGTTFLIILFSIFVWRGIHIARRAPDLLGSLLAAGITIWIAFEAFINMAMMINLVPIAGNSLPFFSAGGSNLVATIASVGILINISRVSKLAGNEVNGSVNATDGLRRGKRRRGESRSRRAPSNR